MIGVPLQCLPSPHAGQRQPGNCHGNIIRLRDVASQRLYGRSLLRTALHDPSSRCPPAGVWRRQQYRPALDMLQMPARRLRFARALDADCPERASCWSKALVWQVAFSRTEPAGGCQRGWEDPYRGKWINGTLLRASGHQPGTTVWRSVRMGTGWLAELDSVGDTMGIRVNNLSFYPQNK